MATGQDLSLWNSAKKIGVQIVRFLKNLTMPTNSDHIKKDRAGEKFGGKL
jgi:hypothetical protein